MLAVKTYTLINLCVKEPFLGLLQKMALLYMGHAFYNNPPKQDQLGLFPS